MPDTKPLDESCEVSYVHGETVKAIASGMPPPRGHLRYG